MQQAHDAGNQTSMADLGQCTLDTLKLGQRGTVTAVISSSPLLRNKLLSMGIVSSTRVQVTNIAPLGDPIGISVRGFKLCLRRSEARSVLIRLDNS
ncbi:MAG: FeoA family protein [Bdellovibrionota bacterium]